MAARSNHQTLSVLVENRSGVLARVSGLFARRGFNIISLAVAPSDDARFSRITIVIDVEETSVEQITKQLFKLVNVIKITELHPDDAVLAPDVAVVMGTTSATRARITPCTSPSSTRRCSRSLTRSSWRVPFAVPAPICTTRSSSVSPCARASRWWSPSTT